MPKVLITGGTGFIAGHCITQLLEQGHTVVTTVRSDEKGAKVLKAHSASKDKLSYQIVKDVAQKGAYDEVISTTPNLDYVIHTTSPFHYNVQDPVKDFLEPAVTGTTSILEAVNQNAPSVKRVVITSSFAAMRNETGPSPPIYDETYWNPITWEEAAEDKKKTYQGSKKLAEKAAWDFMRDRKPNFELVTINPSLVFGPAAPHLEPGDLSSLNTSNMRILDMIDGKMKEKLDPTGFYSWVDVRDVALAHVKAMDVPEAAGKRFFIITGLFENKEIAKIVANMGPEFAKKLPADLDSQEDNLPTPDKRYGFNNEQSIKVLGTVYTPLETSVRDTVTSLLKLKV